MRVVFCSTDFSITDMGGIVRLMMTETSIDAIGTKPGHGCLGCRRLAALLAVGLLALAGCAHVPSRQQRLVSKPNMQFEGAAMFGNLNRLVSQFESSSASSVGGPTGGGGGCPSCGD
ncbi:MAG: hypothetical protein PHN85_10205 [Kiritimatiellae bacterium]|nr:hypothetical protein [Kiritimatiellia bacterium]